MYTGEFFYPTANLLAISIQTFPNHLNLLLCNLAFLCQLIEEDRVYEADFNPIVP